MELVITNVEREDLEYNYGELRYRNTFIKVHLYNFRLLYSESKKSYTMTIIIRNDKTHNLSITVLNKLKATIECEKIMDTTVKYFPCVGTSELLYEYQLKDVEWMEDIEKKVDRGIVISDYLSRTLNNNTIYDSKMNFIDGNIISTPVYARGGCLVNEVGLGKTISVLSLIKRSFDDDIRNKFKVNTNLCNYKYKVNKKRGKFCEKKIKNNNLYCVQHTRNVFQDTLRIELQPDFRPKYKNGRYVSNATLVICPSHLVSQWNSEVHKFFGTSFRVLIIVNIYNLRNLCLHELLCVDLVIMSSTVISQLNINPTDNDIMFSNIFTNDFSWRDIHFKRIVYDESHELLELISIRYKMSLLQSDYVWNVSGTPLPRMYNNYYYNLELLTGIDSKYYMNTVCYDTINKLYRRSTKESVKLKITSITEKIEWVDFLKVEKDIYNSYKLSLGNKITKDLVKLCCHPELICNTANMIKECTSLEEISKKLLGHNIDEIQKLENSITDILKKQRDIQLKVVMTLKDSTMLITCKRMYTETKNKLLSKKRLVDYLAMSLKELENAPNEKDCAICLGEFSESICILPCGHKFCSECMGCVYKKMCPLCKDTINSDMFILNKAVPCHDTEHSNVDLAKELKSSKLAHIVKYIRGLQDTDKCVIFSQWDLLLNKMGKQLKTIGIQCVHCDGSVYKKTASIKKFTNDPNVKVILLSSKNAASGINLVVANKLILIEPVYGNKEYKENIENQAVGRINRIGQEREIDIVRFLVKDTVEEDISNGIVKMNFKI